MKLKINNRARKLITLFIIGVMGMLIGNKIAFTHLHQLDDGTIIEHAHPYNKANDSEPIKSHHHSNAELLFFQNITILFFTAFLTLGVVLFAIRKRVTFNLILEHASTYINLYKGRAPPIS